METHNDTAERYSYNGAYLRGVRLSNELKQVLVGLDLVIREPRFRRIPATRPTSTRSRRAPRRIRRIFTTCRCSGRGRSGCNARPTRLRSGSRPSWGNLHRCCPRACTSRPLPGPTRRVLHIGGPVEEDAVFGL